MANPLSQYGVDDEKYVNEILPRLIRGTSLATKIGFAAMGIVPDIIPTLLLETTPESEHPKNKKELAEFKEWVKNECDLFSKFGAILGGCKEDPTNVDGDRIDIVRDGIVAVSFFPGFQLTREQVIEEMIADGRLVPFDGSEN